MAIAAILLIQDLALNIVLLKLRGIVGRVATARKAGYNYHY
jgi:hypothetical protein